MSRQLKADQVEFVYVIRQIRRHWLLFGLWMTLVAAIAVFGSLSLPNMYKSMATLAANEPGGKAGGLGGALGSVSALAGISLGGSGEKKSVIAIELMKSRQFFTEFAHKHQLKLPLMAANGWDPATDQLSFDPDIYDVKTKQWVRKPVGLRQSEPSDQEVFEAFVRLFSVSQDKLTNVVTVSFEFVSPKLAQQWLSAYIDEVNLQMRARDVAEAESSIAFISEKVRDTALNEVREVLYSMLEEHHKTLVIANVKPDYVFKVIDPPAVADLKAGPVRSLMVLGALLAGLLIFVLGILAVILWRNTKAITQE